MAKLICAGVGRKEYLSAGISSAAAIKFLPTCWAFCRNAFATGDDCAAATHGRRVTARAVRTRSMVGSCVERWLMLCFRVGSVQCRIRNADLLTVLAFPRP